MHAVVFVFISKPAPFTSEKAKKNILPFPKIVTGKIYINLSGNENKYYGRSGIFFITLVPGFIIYKKTGYLLYPECNRLSIGVLVSDNYLTLPKGS